jgi:hypothetical protein
MDVCFPANLFYIYMFLLLMIVGLMAYGTFNVAAPLPQSSSPSQVLIKVQSQLPPPQQKLEVRRSEEEGLLNRIYNPLVPPERFYTGRNVVSSFQMIGYVFNDNDRFPLFARQKFPGRSEKWEYYVMDETRNRLKIPFKSKNDNELYDGDSIDIPTVGNNFSVKIYDYDSLRYNPNV